MSTDTRARSTNARSSRYGIDAVNNALAVLRVIIEEGGVSLEHAAQVAEVSTSTAYRLLATLTDARLASRASRSGYVAGPELHRWAALILGRLDIRAMALPVMRRLWKETNETVNLALLHGSELVYAEILASPSPLRMADAPGVSVPMHAAAIGKVVLAHMEPDRVLDILGPDPFEQLTPKTPIMWKQVSSHIAEAKKRGFAVDDEEVAVGVACVAAPIFQLGRVVGGISVSSPKARLDPARLRALGPLVKEAADEISMLLSGGVEEGDLQQ